MRILPIITLAPAAAAALLVTSAAAAEASTTSIKVRSCQVGVTPKQRQATFYARMRAVSGSNRMMMRFTMIDRGADGTSLVPSPQLAQWRRSRPGVKTFGYAQTVTGLQAGGAYAAIVEYRWVGANGRTIKTARRTSRECRQDGKLANLAVTRVAARSGDVPGTLVYSVDVANRGAAEARAVLVDLFVDDAGADAARVDSIKPGETVTLRVSGPVCGDRLRAVVDRQDAIHETNEDDNVLRSGCPLVGA
jgi:hypothetical protein